MRKFTIVLFAVLCSLSSNAAGIISVPVDATDNAKAGVEATIVNVNAKDIGAYRNLTPKQIEAMTGKKMTFVQKIAFKTAQKKMERQMKKSSSIDIKDKRQMLRLWLIFAALAIGLSIIGWFLPFLWVLSGLAGLASLVFFVLWIIALTA